MRSPENITSGSPEGITEPQPVTEGSPTGQPSDKPLDLCVEHPEILACADLDTPDSGNLPESPAEVTLTSDSGWGADNATCPAPRHVTAGGHDIPIPYDLFCQYMAGIRPIVIAMAFLGAAFILVGWKGGD